MNAEARSAPELCERYSFRPEAIQRPTHLFSLVLSQRRKGNHAQTGLPDLGETARERSGQYRAFAHPQKTAGRDQEFGDSPYATRGRRPVPLNHSTARARA